MLELFPTITYVRSWFRARVGVLGERGATALEYAIVAGFIAAVVVFGVTALGASTKARFASAGGSGLH